MEDLVLVHGDTSTTFAGALSAFYHQVPVGHVEAGLRTYDKYSPYPEEMNRKLVTAIADLYFCPTENNRENLRREGVTEGVFVTGNTVIDALHTTVRPGCRFSTASGCMSENLNMPVVPPSWQKKKAGPYRLRLCGALIRRGRPGN